MGCFILNAHLFENTYTLRTMHFFEKKFFSIQELLGFEGNIKWWKPSNFFPKH